MSKIKEFGYIYKITNNVNNKVYIGQTITPIKRRYSKHFSVDKETISNRLKSMEVSLYTQREALGISVVVETPTGEKIEFNSKMSASEWFIQNGITKSDKIECVRRKIKNGLYYSHKITLLQ